MKLLEVKRKILVIYPGGFHPFHLGHASVYSRLKQQFPGADVYVAASNTTTERPFSFEEKKFMAQQAGVPESQFVLVKSPYQSKEITENYDADNTVLIFATSQKDAERFKFTPKKDGTASYFQPFESIDASEPMSQHGYIYIAPVKKFSAAGRTVTSASALRDMYVNGDDRVRSSMISDLYPRSSRHSHIKQIMDRVLLGESLTEEFIAEIAMSPGELRRWADSPAAQGIRVGIEYELIFPDTAGDDDDDEDYEPDYDMDQRADSIDEVIDFFQGGDTGIAPRTAERLRRDLYEEFNDWIVESFDDDVGESEFVDWMEEKIWPDVEDQYRDQAREELADDADDDAITEQAVKLFREEAESQYQDRGDWYDQAYESLMDDYKSNVDEGDWLRENYRYMSDIENAWNLDWPYYRSIGRDAGDIDWSSWADEIAGVVDMPVRVSQGYHSAKRTADSWIMEPDSSLEPSNDEDAGIELISPPLPLPEALAKFDAISAWARSRGVYTNSSTGLHMNISVPVSEVDYVKLILFMGDQYVLDQFGRGANSYTRSAYEKISDLVRSKRRSVGEVTQPSPGVYSGGVDIAAAMELMKKNLIELAGRYVQGGVGGSKYTSAHVKDTGKGTYIEFRGPGNDWLDDRESVKTARDTMLRFARAMTIAGDPSAERREYAKKFYKLLSGYRSTETVKTGRDTRYQTRIETDDEDPFAQLFAKYSSGMISGQELKREWADTVLDQQRDREARAPFTAGDQGQDYEIFDRGTGEVLDRLTGYAEPAAAVIRAQQLYSGTNVNYGVRRAAAAQDPKKKTDRRAELAQRVTRSTRDVGEQLWRVNLHSSQQWVTARSQAAAVAKAIQQDRMFDNPQTRARIATDTERQQWQLDQLRRQQRDQQDREINQATAAGGEPTGEWSVRDRAGFLVTTLRPPEAMQSQDGAERYAQNWIARSRPDLDASDITVTQLTTEPEPIPGFRIANDPRQTTQGEFTGGWLIRDAQGRTLHRLSGIGNSQADANRVALRWLAANGYGSGTEVEVVPEMR